MSNNLVENLSEGSLGVPTWPIKLSLRPNSGPFKKICTHRYTAERVHTDIGLSVDCVKRSTHRVSLLILSAKV